MFSAVLIVVAALFHRMLGMGTAVALNLFKIAFIGAGLAILIAAAAIALIWRRGAAGVPSSTAAILIALGIVAWPLSSLPLYYQLPEVNDITTDTQSPPPFIAAAKLRADTPNGIEYPGTRFAALQAEAYPDIRPYVIARGVEEAYDLMFDVLSRQLRFKIIAEEAPNARTNQPGRLEATDRTLLLGFYDDVVVRITGDQSKSRIDVRSASRFGRHDLGRNAQRVRLILKGLQVRLEQTMPASGANGLGRWRNRDRIAVPKRPKGGSPATMGARTSPDRGQPDAQRGQAPKAKQPAKDERRGRDKRRPQFE